VTNNDDQRFPFYRSPSSIRDETFTRRMRGLDEEEVYEYLDLLADQVQAAETERRELRAENERLQTEVERQRQQLEEAEQAGGRVNDQVVEMFSQAQLIAEEMVEDVSRDARERLGEARAHGRRILEDAVQDAQHSQSDAEAMIARAAGPDTGSPATSSSDGWQAAPQTHTGGGLAEAEAEIEQVRSFARAAQTQMQEIMDSLAKQMESIGAKTPEAPTPAEPSAPSPSQPDTPWSASADDSTSNDDVTFWQLEAARRGRLNG
jgi:DivIVA domain-containing protein